MVDEDTLWFCFGLLALIPLSYSLKFITSTRARYLYSSIAGLLLQLFVYRSSMLPIFLQHLIVFAIIKLRPRSCGALVTFEAMLFLSAYHVHEYVTNYGGWKMNAVGLLMILVCKYSLLAYNLQDGAREVSTLSPEQQKNRITQEVGFLQFMGYLNFLPTSLIGPPLEFNDYQNFMEFGEVYSSVPDVIPITIKTLGETVLFGALHIIGDVLVPLTPLKTNEFYSEPLWFIFLYSTVSVYLIRCKYYFGWKLSMSAVHASGVSFSGKDFKRINTVDPGVFESSIHVRDKINNWNISVQEWLRKAVYLRSPLKSKTANQLYVFTVSAFWHGIYSAYYISEVLWFVQLHLQTLMFKYFNGNDTLLNRIYAKLGKAGTFLLALLVSLEFNHNSTYFVILEGEYCWKFMQRMYFVPELGLLVLIAVFTVLPDRKKKERREAKTE